MQLSCSRSCFQSSVVVRFDYEGFAVLWSETDLYFYRGYLVLFFHSSLLSLCDVWRELEGICEVIAVL